MFTRPPAFIYKNNELHCERVPLTRLTKKYGTPLYVYSATAMRERFRILDRAFRSVKHTICYSVKANSNLSLLRLMAGLGAGFDIVSGGELERVRLARKQALGKVVFSGVGKTEDELLLALGSGIQLFNVESEGELELLAQCAARLGRTANIALRVNPDVPAETHPYISTGLREHKFGVPITAARALYDQAAKHKFLRVTGVSLHIGSQISDVRPFRLAMERVVELVGQLAADGHWIRMIDVGGGLGISYDSSHPIDLMDMARHYADAVIQPLRTLKGAPPHLLLEPGRFIVAPVGGLLTRVLNRKNNGNKRFTIVDAAMNDLIRPSLYGARHEIALVVVRPDEETEVSDVAGPICESGDFLARDAVLPAAAPGDYLCILDAGAYGMSLASNYNTRLRPAEVLIDGRRAKLVRRRENIKDLLKPETSCL
ncbi:MAG TPA: diaminopimelate decarboxylase [Terriglobales bacterium]